MNSQTIVLFWFIISNVPNFKDNIAAIDLNQIDGKEEIFRFYEIAEQPFIFGKGF